MTRTVFATMSLCALALVWLLTPGGKEGR